MCMTCPQSSTAACCSTASTRCLSVDVTCTDALHDMLCPSKVFVILNRMPCHRQPALFVFVLLHSFHYYFYYSTLLLPKGKVRPADKLQSKAATILPLVGLARSKQDPINRENSLYAQSVLLWCSASACGACSWTTTSHTSIPGPTASRAPSTSASCRHSLYSCIHVSSAPWFLCSCSLCSCSVC